MYLDHATITDIRGLRRAELGFDKGHEAGWHVLLGDNGAGKSALIRSIALALVGPDEAAALREDWSRWIRWGESTARIEFQVNFPDDWDVREGPGAYPSNRRLEAAVELHLVHNEASPPQGSRPSWVGRRAVVKAPERDYLLSSASSMRSPRLSTGRPRPPVAFRALAHSPGTSTSPSCARSRPASALVVAWIVFSGSVVPGGCACP